MITTQQVIDRLNDRLDAALFEEIGGSVEFMWSFERKPASPTCYVIPSAERVGEQRDMTVLIDQRVTVQFTIVIAITLPRDEDEDTAADAESLREAVKDAVLGWTVPASGDNPGATDPFVYNGWRMLAMAPDGASLYWGLDISSAYHERRSNNP